MLSKLIKNTASNFVFKLLSITLNLVLIPVVVGVVGADGYGLMVLAAGIMGNLTIMDFGFGKGNLRYIAEYKAKGEMNTVARIINTSFSLFFCFGSLVALIIILLIYTGIIDFFQVGDKRTFFIHLLFIAAGLSLLTWPAKILDSSLKGLNEYHKNNIAMTVGNLLSPSLTIVAALMQLRIEWIFAIQHISYLSSWVFQFYVLKRKLPGWKFNPIHFDRNIIKMVYNLSLWSFLNQLASVLLYQADKIILVIFLPVASLTVYKVITIPFQYIGVITNLASSAIVPRITEDFVHKGEQAMTRYYYTGSKYSNIVSSTCSVLVILLIHPFVNLWMGEEYISYVWIIQVACLFQIIWKSNMFLGKALFGYGKITELSIIAIIIAVLNIPISIFLIPYFGVGGVVFGTLIAGFISILLQYIFVFPKYSINLIRYWKEIVVFGQLPAVIVGFILWYSVRSLLDSIHTIWYLLGFALLIGAAIISIYWFISIEKEHKLKLKALFER